MPRSFDLTADYLGTVNQVHSAFSDEHYWLARLAGSGADTATLDSMTTDDGGVAVVTTQGFRRDRLPAMVIQFHRGDLEIVRNETWTPVRENQARAEVTGAVLGAPATLTGSAVLAESPHGARLSFTATVAVNIPLVGGKVETFIGGKLAELAAAEQRFTTVWIADNA